MKVGGILDIDRIDWDRFSDLSASNAFEIADLVFGGSDSLIKVMEVATSKEDKAKVWAIINKACVNPLFRYAYFGFRFIDGFPGIDENEQLLSRSHVGTMSPKVLKWMRGANVNQMWYLKKVYALLDLDILSRIASQDMWNSHSYTYTNGHCKIMDVDVPKVFPESKLRAWYDAYVENFRDTNNDAKVALYTGDKSYSLFWQYLRDRFGDDDRTRDVRHIDAKYHFGSFKLDCLKNYLSAWEGGWDTLLGGNDYKRAFTTDLDVFERAVDALSKGDKTIVAWTLTDARTGDGMKFIYPVDEILSKDRMRLVVDGYLPYMKAKMRYLCEKEHEDYAEEYASFLNVFPGSYKKSLNYMVTETTTPEERLEALCDTSDPEYVDMLPTSWCDMSMDDLVESLVSLSKTGVYL